MIGQTAELPAGTTLYHCPLCPWTHAQPPATIHVRPGLTLADVVGGMLTSVEGEVKAHLETHSLVEWVQEACRLQRELDAARSALIRVSAEKQRQEQSSLLVTLILTRKLGGSATLTDAEMAAEDGTLVRVPEMHGFTLVAADQEKRGAASS